MGAKVLLRTSAVVSFILLVTIVDLNTTDQVQGRRIGSSKTTPLTSSATSEDKFADGESRKHEDQKLVHPKQLDFNYMSKRRVPKGPDPIHNRRTGNSGRPPGQA